MLRHVCGSLALSIIIIYSIIHLLSLKTITTFIIPILPKQPIEPLTPMLSATARRSQIMDQMLTSKEIRNLSEDEQLFLSKYMVSDIAKDLSVDLRNKMNAIENDEDDAKKFSMNVVNGRQSVQLSFSDFSDSERQNSTMSIQKAFALQSGFHWSTIHVEWNNVAEQFGPDSTRNLLNKGGSQATATVTEYPDISCATIDQCEDNYMSCCNFQRGRSPSVYPWYSIWIPCAGIKTSTGFTCQTDDICLATEEHEDCIFDYQLCLDESTGHKKLCDYCGCKKNLMVWRNENEETPYKHHDISNCPHKDHPRQDKPKNCPA